MPFLVLEFEGVEPDKCLKSRDRPIMTSFDSDNDYLDNQCCGKDIELDHRRETTDKKRMPHQSQRNV